MTKEIQTERRWLRSVIAASTEPLPNFPWMRGEKRRPQALETAPILRVVPVHPHLAQGPRRRAPIAAH
ncbi:hypothetical protein [Neotabrizicola sp. sgz301269]|uniref:hypothetical protein n=1 Tax=Neotabrizicola sp. sgz301269 TaxID=3276282 RepID=UPI0037705166